jgi:quinone-modifying oxidoreductase subunit QmoC
MSETRLVDPDLGFIREVKKLGGDTLKKCYQCATCSTVCNLSPEDKPFPRKEMILAGWGQTERLVQDPDVWLCHQCNDCTTHCPREARPGDVLAAIRSYAYRHFAFPSFMGKALASPKTLPALLLTPVIILLLCVVLFAPQAADGDYLFWKSNVIDFNIFLPHSSVDALFVLGNIIIFIFASIGFTRFWKGLHPPGKDYQASFIKGLLLTARDILTHNRFRECGANRPRLIAHMILFYGFLGAMVTTGAIFVSVFIPHYLEALGLEGLHALFAVPIDLPNPIKFVGVLSGLAMIIGGDLLISRRWNRKDDVGANGYADYLFLYMFFLVGLTGMLSWLARLHGIPMIAYVIYFLHLVCVFFLLWYMPYSKFAHMIYRTLAMVHARSIGRIRRG